jgi:O-antigen ligase
MMRERMSKTAGIGRQPAGSGGKGRTGGLAVPAMLALLAGFLLLCALTGGSSRWDVTLLLLLRPLSVLCLAGVLLLPGQPLRLTPPLVLLLLWAAIMVVQLLPLPPAVWTQLPGRAEIVEAVTAAGLQPEWRSLSLTPDLTWNSLLTLLPPLVVLIGYVRIVPAQRPWLVWALVGIGTLSAALGALQMTTDVRLLYFYRVPGGATPMGLFPNHNHQAAFLALMLPFLRAWTLLPAATPGARRTRGIVAAALGLLMLVILLLTGSRAGLALGLLGMLAAWLIHPRVGRDSGEGKGIAFWKAAALVAGPISLIALVIMLGKALALDELLATGGVEEEQRFRLLPAVLDAVRTYFPFGAGFGSFDAVFRHFEPEFNLSPSYFNHAHNDFVEIALEGGAAALLVLAGFLVWFCWCALGAWRSPVGRTGSRVWIARAASFGVIILGASSLVDYPLRTPLLAAVFALMCAMVGSAKLGVSACYE